MSFRPYIPQELYSMHSLEKNFRIGKRQQRWYERSHRTTNCRIIRFLQPIRSAKSMVILQASILPVLTVEKEAEVYSRITGYYRPVQNWNDGKTQEYKDRKLYEISPSKLSEVKTNIVTISKDEVKVEPTDNIRYLFTTKTCPNCAAAKEILGEENYVLIDAEENQELVEKYGVMQAPTLVVVENNRAKKNTSMRQISKSM